MLIVCDFDNSAADHNAAQAVLGRFDAPEIKQLRSEYDSGDISFKKYQELVFQATRAGIEEISKQAVEAVKLRQGFVDAVIAAHETGATFIIASAGILTYIRPVLTLNGLEGLPVVAVSVTYAGPLHRFQFRPGHELPLGLSEMRGRPVQGRNGCLTVTLGQLFPRREHALCVGSISRGSQRDREFAPLV